MKENLFIKNTTEQPNINTNTKDNAPTKDNSSTNLNSNHLEIKKDINNGKYRF